MRFRHLTSAVAQILLNASGGAILQAGGTLVIGTASAGQGTSYVYDTNLELQTTLTGSGGYYGKEITIGENKFAVATHDGNSNGGQVYIYNHDGSGEQVLTASDGASGNSFGATMDMVGDTLVVGAPEARKIYIYDLSAADIAASEVKIHKSAIQDFGREIGVGGGKVVVGTQENNTTWSGSKFITGSAFVYDIDGTNEVQLIPQQNGHTLGYQTTDGGNRSNDEFGKLVAIGGDKIFVGARMQGNDDKGAVHVFSLDGTYETMITPSSPVGGSYFASGAIAVTDTKLVVTAPEYAISGKGTVYVFDHDGSNEVNFQSQYATSTMGRQSVAVLGNRIIVEWQGANSGKGQLHVFDMDGSNESVISAPAGVENNDLWGNEIDAITGSYPMKMFVAEGRKTYANDQKIYVMDIDGENLIELPAPEGLSQPSSSRYGDNIEVSGTNLVVIDPHGRTAYVYDLTSTDAPTSFSLDSTINVSATDHFVLEGNRLIVNRNPYGSPGRILVYNITNGNLDASFTNSDNAGFMRMDVGNDKIVATSGYGDTRKIYVYDIDDTTGSSETIITPPAPSNTSHNCNVAVGNGKIAYADNEDDNTFYIYNLDGSNEVVVDVSSASLAGYSNFGQSGQWVIGVWSMVIGNDKIVLNTSFTGVFVISDLDGSNLTAISMSNLGYSGDEYAGFADLNNGAIYVVNNKIMIGATAGRISGNEGDGIVYTFDLDGSNPKQILAPRGAESGYKFGKDIAANDPTGLTKFANLPAVISNIDASYTLTEGQDTVITAGAVDPEGDAITWSFEEVKSGTSYVVVSSPTDDDVATDSGSVYVYNANNLSAAPTKLTAYDADTSDGFGRAVLVTPDRIFIGAYGDKTDSGQVYGGAVYIYDTNNLSAQPIKLAPSDRVERSFFGSRIAVNSNKLVIGARDGYNLSSNQGYKGAIYVYDLNDLSADPIKIVEGTRGNQHKFGEYMSLNENYLAVGVPDRDVPTTNVGMVYLYDINDLSVAPIEIAPTSLLSYDSFGNDVELTSSKLFVGAAGDDELGNGTGAVYVYDLNDLSAEPTKLTAFDGSTPPPGHGGDTFGEFISANDDKVVISAYRKTIDGLVYQGAAYVYDLNDLSAQATQLLVGDDGDTEFEFFGSDVAITDDHVIIGAYDDGGQRGSTFVYDLNDLSAEPTKLTAFDAAYQDRFGTKVAAISAPSALNDVTVTQSDNVFTITPGSIDSNFTLRFKVTDAAGNVTTKTSTFTYDYVNKAPTVSGIVSEYNLTQGQDTVITAIGTDPEGDAITWSFEEVGESYIFVKGGSNTYVYDPSTMQVLHTLPYGLTKMSVGSGKFAGMSGTTAYVYDLSDLSAAPITIPNNPSVDSTALFDNKLYVGQPDQNSNFGQITVYDLNDLNASPTLVYSSSNRSHAQFAKNIRVAGNKLFATQERANNEAYGIVQVWDTNDLSAAPTVINNPMNVFLDGWMEVTETHLVFSSTYGNEGSLTNAGTVYVYDLNDLSSPQATVTASSRSSSDYFGKYLAVSSKYLMVQNYGNARKVHVFDMTDLSAAPVELNDGVSATFGRDLSIVGDNLFVGESDVNTSTGRLFVYDGTDLSSAPQEIAGSAEYDNFTSEMVGYPAPSALNGVTITQSDNVFTVTPGTSDANFQLRITATDSEGNATSVTSTFGYTVPVPVVNDTSVGRIIAAASNNNYSNKLYAFDLDGSNEKELFIPAGMDNGSQFGADENMAIDGTTLVVGQRSEQRVFVYDLATTNEPIEITPPAPSNLYGTSVAISDGKIIVGTYEGASTVGAFYIYDLDGSNEIKVTEPSAGLPGAGSQNGWTKFGFKVAAGHGRIVVGAPMADADGVQDSGQVYIYDMQGTFINTISATDGQTESDQFGDYEIAIGNGKIAVAAYVADGGSINSFTGSVYLYDLDGSNEIRLYDPALTGSARFGTGLAIGHEKVVVGSDNGAHFYIFDLDGSNMQKIASTGNKCISVANNRIVVGDYGKTVSESASGELRVYDMSGNLLNTIHQSNPTNRAFLGSSLAMYDTADARAHNFAPTVSGIDAAYTLTQGQNTVITAAATDPEGDAITWSFEEIKSGASYVVVGSTGDDDNGSSSGSVYVYDANDLSAQPTKLTAYDGAADDGFGSSVVTTADKIIVGAMGDTSFAGSVYVYDANDLSAQPTKLTAFDGAAVDLFGISVAATADKIVVGAMGDDDNGSSSGSVYVYDANDLSAQPTKLTAFDGAVNDNFGYSVAVTSDKIIVGSYGDGDNGNVSGSVYVYNANNLSAQPTKLTAFDGVSAAYFGWSVAATGDKVIVSAKEDNSGRGAVYVFDANDLTAQPTKLTSPDDVAYTYFGESVSVLSDRLVVGASAMTTNNVYQGAAYVYDLTNLSATPTKLTAFDGAAYDYFGHRVAVMSDSIVVSAHYDNDNGNASGSVYVFDANDLSAQPTKLTAYDGAANDAFGNTLAAIAVPSALNGTTVTQSDNVFTVTPGTADANFQLRITATDSEGNATSVTSDFALDYQNQAPAVSGIDAAYTLTQGQDTVITAAATDPEGDAITWSFEEVMSGSNYVIVGASSENDNGTRSGAVYVYDANDLSSPATKLNVSGNAADDYLGFSVDVSDDKIVVGAPYDDDNGTNAGAVYVFDTNDLSATPIQLTAHDFVPSDDWGDQFGRSVAVTSNKIVVGAMRNTENGYNAGAAYVFDISDLSAQPTKLAAYDGAESDQFGYTVAAAGDKIVITSPFDDDNATNSGSVYVYDANDLSAQPTKLTAYDGAANDSFGFRAVAVTADKIVVGAAYNTSVADTSGSVYVFDANDLSTQPTKLTAFDGAKDDLFGYSVAANADKIVVGAQRDDDMGGSSGSVYVYDANDLSAQPTKLTAFDGLGGDYFGTSVAISGDKIVVGSDQGQFNVYVYDLNDLSAQPEVLTQSNGFGNAVAAISSVSALNGVTVTQSDNVFTVTPGTADADFQLRITATDSEGNATSVTPTFNFDYVNQAPSVTGIDAAYTLTQGQDTVITGTATDPEGDAITWSFEEVLGGSAYVAVSDYKDGSSTGAVYVYDTSDLSASPTKITPYDGTANDNFGRSIAMSSTKMVVGAHTQEDENNQNDGAVYVYDLSDLSAQPTKIEAYDHDSSLNQDMQFGQSVAISDNLIVVGSIRAGSSGAGDMWGAFYVYDANDFSFLKKVTADSQYNEFSKFISLTDTQLVVSMQGYDAGGLYNVGAVYVYDTSDLDASPTMIVNPDPDQHDQFGKVIAASEDIIAIRANEDDDTNGGVGAVFVYDANDLSASPTKLTVAGLDDDSDFGAAMSIASGKLIISASGSHEGGADNTGSVYVYDISDLSASPTQLIAYDAAPNDYFGYSLATSGNQLFIGMPWSDDTGSDMGSFYVYDMNDLTATPSKVNPPAITSSANTTFSMAASQPSSSLNGVTIAQSDNVFTVTPGQQDATFQLTFKATDTAGNVTSVTSDFTLDYVNQAPSVTGIESSYLLSAGGDAEVITAAATDPEGDAITWSFEEVVSGGGSQIVIGSFLKNNYSGSVFVYENGDLSSSPTEIYPSDVASGDRFGQEIAVTPSHMAVSTWNGKVYVYDQSDLSVAPTKLTSPEGVGNFGQEGLAINDTHLFVGQLSGGPDSNGVVYVYSLSDLSASPTELSQTGGEFLGDGGDRFGSVVAADNQSLVVSATHYDNGVGAQNVGRLYVYDVNDLSAAPTIVSNVGYQNNSETGNRELMLTSDKIIVGSYAHEDGSGVRKGAVFVHDRNNLDQAPVIVIGHEENSNFGLDAYSDGDILVVGAASENSSTGAAYVYDMSDLSAAPTKLTAYDGAANDGFGWGVYATDSNILIGSYNDDDAGNNSGAVYVYDRSDLSVQPTKLIGQGPNAYFGNTFAGYAPNSALNGSTVTQSDNVFTVTPGSGATSFSMRFTATDSEGNATSVTSAFSIVEPAAPLLVIGASNDNQVGADAGAVYVYDRTDLTATPTKIVAPAATTPMTSTYTMKHLNDDGSWDSGAESQFHTETPEHAEYVADQFNYVVNNLLTGTQKVARMEFLDMSGRTYAYFAKNESIDSVTGEERGPSAPYNEVGRVYITGTPGSSSTGGFYSISGLPYTEMRAIRFIDAQGNHIYTSETLEYTPLKGYFGSAVEFVNNKMVVSAPYSSTQYGEKSGRLFVYNPSDLTSDPVMLSLPESMSSGNLYMGKQLAYDSTRIFAGTPNDDTGRGSVFVFDTDDLSADPVEMTSPESAPYDNFGFSVATNSTSLFVGEPRSNESGISDTGLVFVYDLNDISATPTKLTAPTLTSDERFGDFVVATDQHVVVSSPTALSYKGKVYVYDATDLSATPTELIAPDGLNNDQFGRNMVLSGNTLAVAAPYADPHYSGSGAVYVYDMSNLSAAPTKLMQSDPASNDQFGGNDSYAMEISDNKLYIPSRGSDGSVYVFDLTNLSAAPTKITSIDSHSGQNFGLHIAAN